ncbi:hypothetical protein D3C86_1147940 [compost metagenome]
MIAITATTLKRPVRSISFITGTWANTTTALLRISIKPYQAGNSPVLSRIACGRIENTPNSLMPMMIPAITQGSLLPQLLPT